MAGWRGSINQYVSRKRLQSYTRRESKSKLDNSQNNPGTTNSEPDIYRKGIGPIQVITIEGKNTKRIKIRVYYLEIRMNFQKIIVKILEK